MKTQLENLGVFKDHADGTLKTVFDAGEKQIVEITLLCSKEDMDIICAPTHHFCNLGCKMCHLTNKGLNKQMKPISKDIFLEALINSLTKPIYNKRKKRTDKKKLLISFMGVGEPLLNLNLIREIYSNEEYIKKELGYEKIGYAISTIIPKDISQLTELVYELNIPLKLHFSLHTPLNHVRFELIPATKITAEDALKQLAIYRTTVQSNRELMKEYAHFHSTNDPVEIHYTLMEDVNDGEEELEKVCSLLKKYKVPIKFIRFNPITDLTRSSKEEEWITTIKKEVPDLRIKTFTPPGKNIGSSCGEFTKHYYHEEIETEKQLEEFHKWKIRHQIG